MKIASFAQACKLLKYNPKTVLPNVSKMPMHLRAHTVAKAKLEIIAEASRGSVELDYDNTDQRKWGGWFRLDKPGFRFGGAGCGLSGTYSGGGPRLCYLSEEDTVYHCQKHIALYKAAIVIPKKKAKKK
jgi:hypothetical protein